MRKSGFMNLKTKQNNSQTKQHKNQNLSLSKWKQNKPVFQLQLYIYLIASKDAQ